MIMNRSLTIQPADGWLMIHDLSQLVESSSVSSVLELMVAITGATAAHLYWMDPAAYELRLVSASSTSEDCRIPRVSMRLPAAVRRWLEGLREPVVLTADDSRFTSFPETSALDLAGLLVSPLCREHGLAGILTLSRTEKRAFGPGEIAAVAKASDALMAAMKEAEERREVEALREKLRSARQENSHLEKKLAERKLVERAKGLLQEEHRWTEEDAYYHLRRTSRQQRTPMAVIAQRVIDVAVARETEREPLSA
jgi:GAF domain-containing protein